MLKKICEKYEEQLYFLFRIIIGLLFLAHGGQKLFGWFGKEPAMLMSLMGLAGVIELLAGLGIVLGFMTRTAAFFSAVLMVVAYFMAHASKGLVPLTNGGELAVLYFAAFLVLMIYGAGRWSLEQKIFKRERW